MSLERAGEVSDAINSFLDECKCGEDVLEVLSGIAAAACVLAMSQKDPRASMDDFQEMLDMGLNAMLDIAAKTAP